MKETVGRALGSDELEAKGLAQEAKGEAQKLAGDAKGAIKTAASKAADLVNKKF